MRKLAIIISLLLTVNTLWCNVSGLSYQIRFNELTQEYDCFIIINAGSATAPSSRIQLNAQYSVVVPTGSTVTMSNKYLPLQNNLNYDGVSPCNWFISSWILHPTIQPENDFYSIVPTISPISRYNNLSQNDTIKLFSLNIFPIPYCKNEVRNFINGVDPNSTADGMQGTAFTNAFSIGSTSQLYQNNVAPPNSGTLVTNLLDEGLGSLRHCILCALAGSTISFIPEITGDTINIVNGNLEIAKNLIISNDNFSEIRLNSSMNDCIFKIALQANVTLNNLALITNSTNTINGKAIQNQGILKLSNINFLDNAGSGITIYNRGSLTIENGVSIW